MPWNNQTQYGVYRTRKFNEIYPTVADFKTDYINIGLGGLKDETVNLLYVLLYARRGNDAIMSSDETRFRYELFSLIFRYGPEYEKKAEIQAKLRALSDAELERGTTSINNFANNPSTTPTTQDFEQLRKINSQTATGYKRSRIEALTLQREALTSAYIETFLSRFDSLFNPYPPEYPLIYTIGECEDD